MGGSVFYPYCPTYVFYEMHQQNLTLHFSLNVFGSARRNLFDPKKKKKSAFLVECGHHNLVCKATTSEGTAEMPKTPATARMPATVRVQATTVKQAKTVMPPKQY
jgi:hypothetical protein